VKRSPALLLGVAASCVALDQWTKHWASTVLAFRRSIHIVDDLVRLTYTRNSGIAFGMFAGRNFPFYIFSIVAALAVFALFMRHERLSLPRQLSLAFILGGAVGNLIDRVATGEVVDFILLSWGHHEFPVFNVADMAVTCGVVLFALAWTQEHEAPPVAETPEGGTHEQEGGADGADAGRGPAGGSLAGEGADRPLP